MRRKKSALLGVLLSPPGVGAFVAAGLFFGTLCVTAYMNGRTEALNREIAKTKHEISLVDRDIEDLRIKIEKNTERRQIEAKIAQFNLGLRAPEPRQVVELAAKPVQPAKVAETGKGKKVVASAASSKGAGMNTVGD